MRHQFLIQTLCSAALLAVAFAGPAAAEDPENMPWTRTETRTGGMLWVSSEDLADAGSPQGGVASLRVLWPHPEERGLGEGLTYAMSEFTFLCRAGGVHEDIWTFRVDGPAEEPEPRPDREVKPGTLEFELFGIACEGEAALTDIEVGSGSEALEYEAMARDRGWNPPARSWDPGPGGEDRETVEPREPPPPRDGDVR